MRNWWSSRKGHHRPDNRYSRWEQDYVLVNFSQLGLFYEYLEMGEALFEHEGLRYIHRLMSCSLSCLSDPVRLHHSVCGLLPPGPPPGPVQQHPGNQGGCLEVHHPVQAADGLKGSKHWSMAGDPQRSGHFVCCHQCESNLSCWTWTWSTFEPLLIITRQAFPLTADISCFIVFQSFIMAFTSDMIPRLVYLYAYSQHGNMEGYINNSLSVYNISQIPLPNMPEDDWHHDSSTCRCSGSTCTNQWFTVDYFKLHRRK